MKNYEAIYPPPYSLAVPQLPIPLCEVDPSLAVETRLPSAVSESEDRTTIPRL